MHVVLVVVEHVRVSAFVAHVSELGQSLFAVHAVLAVVEQVPHEALVATPRSHSVCQRNTSTLAPPSMDTVGLAPADVTTTSVATALPVTAAAGSLKKLRILSVKV